MCDKIAYFPQYSNPQKYFASAIFSCPISIGMPYHKGDDFFATVELLKSIPGSQIKILIADELQRFTLGLKSIFKKENRELCIRISNEITTSNHSKTLFEVVESFREPARKAGLEWLDENQTNPKSHTSNGQKAKLKALDLLTLKSPTEQSASILIPGDQIIFWHQWLNHPDFVSCKKLIDNAYTINNGDATFTAAINRAAAKVSNNLANQCTDYFDNQISTLLCTEYIKEECAVFILWTVNNLNKIIYPVKNSPAHATMKDKIAYFAQQYLQLKNETGKIAFDIKADFIDIKLINKPALDSSISLEKGSSKSATLRNLRFMAQQSDTSPFVISDIKFTEQPKEKITKPSKKSIASSNYRGSLYPQLNENMPTQSNEKHNKCTFDLKIQGKADEVAKILDCAKNNGTNITADIVLTEDTLSSVYKSPCSIL